MAKIPSAQDINRSVPQYGRQIVGLTPDPSGRALQQFGEGIARAGEIEANREKEIADKLALARFDTELHEGLNNELMALEGDINYGTHKDRFTMGAAKVLNEKIKYIQDPTVRELAELRARERISTLQYSVTNKAQGIRAEVEKAGLLEDARSLENQYASLDPALREGRMRSFYERGNSLKNERLISSLEWQSIDASVTEAISTQELSSLKPDELLSVLGGKGLPLKDSSGTAVGDEAIEIAMADYGLDGEWAKFAKTVANIESSGNATQKSVASKGKYVGLFQFGVDRAKEVGLIDRTDPVASAKAFVSSMKEYVADFQKSGIEPTWGNLYLAHQQGLTGAKELITRGDELAVDVVGKQAVLQNDGNTNMTASEFADKWRGKVDGSSYKKYLANVSPEKQSALGRVAEAQYASEEMRFAAPQRRAEIAIQFQDNPAVMAEYKRTQDAIKKDPAAYVAVAPNVMAAQEAFAQEPNEENRAAYLDALKQTQRQIGVPDSKVRYISKAQADEFKAITEAANATPDQVLGALDAMKQTYEPVWRNAVGDLYDAGVKGPWNVLAQMGQNAYRAELAQAIISGEKTLTAAIPQSEKSGENINNALNLEIDKVMEPYQFALGTIDGGSEALSNARSSMVLLSKSYMAKGMPSQKAVTEAARGIFPEKAYGTIILPEGTDGKIVQSYAEDLRAQFTEDDIIVPANIAASPAAALEYAKRELSEARPITSGDEIIFIGSSGKPILLKDKAERDELGRITNPREAAMSFKIADSLTYSEEASAMAAPDSIGNLRAVAAATLGEDIKKYYSPRASVKGVEYWGKTPKIDGLYITKDNFAAMSPEQKKMAKEKIAANVEYNKTLLSLFKTETERAAAKAYIQKSSDMLVESSESKKAAKLAMKEMSGKKLTPDEAMKFKELKGIMSRDLVGVGLQYIEVPEWAK